MIQMDQASPTDNPDNSNNIDINKGFTSFANLAPNEVGSSWYVYSLFSWLIFISAQFIILFGKKNMLNGFPLAVEPTLIIIYLLIINITGLAITAKRTIYDKDQGFMNTFFGEHVKQLSFGFLFASGAIITLRVMLDLAYSLIKGESKNYDFIYGLFSLNLIFAILGGGCLFHSYTKIEQQSEWYEMMIIKKGVLSSTIGVLLYCMCLSSIVLGIYNESDQKGLSISFVIILALCNIGISFNKRDLGFSVVNLIIYISITSISFMDSSKENKAPKIISLCFVGISFIHSLYLIFNMRDQLIKA